MPFNLYDTVSEIQRKRNSLLCVGIDPDPKEIESDILIPWCCTIIDITYEYVCAYKFNLAFFESYGIQGLNGLYRILKHLLCSRRLHNENKPPLLIGDGKCTDVPHTMEKYAQAMFGDLESFEKDLKKRSYLESFEKDLESFEKDLESFERGWGFDCCTVTPFCGRSSVQPFVDYKDKGTFVLCSPTSNDFTYINTHDIINDFANAGPNVGLIVGASRYDFLNYYNKECSNKTFLIPGLGAQGAGVSEIKSTVREGNIFTFSRSIIYNKDPENKARYWRDTLNAIKDRRVTETENGAKE